MMKPKLAQELAAAVERMPAFPKSVQRILELTQETQSTPKDLIQVIEKDPVLTVKILKVVNSAYFGLPKQINSIGHAVVYLGFNATKNLALGMTAIGMLPRDNAAGFDWHQYLLHSLATAGIAKQLAQRVRNADATDCFIAGLLHDFGKVVFVQFMPSEFRQALQLCQANVSSLHLALREVIGADHAFVGAMLVEKWRFAPQLVETIRHQSGDDVQDTDMVACVFAANQISKKLKFGFGGNPLVEELPVPLATRLGGSLDEVITSLGDLSQLFEEARIFARL